MIKTYPVFSLLFFWVFTLSGQSNFTISGFISDSKSGETLLGANVYNTENSEQGTFTNSYGFYSLTLPVGVYDLSFSFLGYQEQVRTIKLVKNLRINVDLIEGLLIDELTISAMKADEDINVKGTQMGTIDIPIQNIKRMPSLLGEVDILKVIQLLPGVLSSGEGSSGFNVRGGSADQNLVLLDEAVVYNSGHLMGFFSVFNSDAIKNATLIKGGMPANYGGRLSSVLDIKMKEGNNRQFGLQGGIGLVSSRLTLEGPLVKNKSSFILSGRRTYIGDLAQFALKGGDFEGTNYYFYDLNTKVNYQFSDRDRLFISAYFGRDILKFRNSERAFNFDLPYGNTTATIRWNHIVNEKMFVNTSLIYNDYKFKFEGNQEQLTFGLFSAVEDVNAKIDFDFFPNPNHHLKYGINYTYHKLTPNTVRASNGEQNFELDFKPKYAHEAAIYLLDDIKINSRFSANIGLRGSMFTQIGPYLSPVTGEEFGRFEPVKRFFGLEPRLSAKYSFSETNSMKLGITYAKQYIHLVSNSTTTLPTDIWVPSSERVNPQQGLQVALGYFQNFSNNGYEGSIELYFKDLRNQIDYGEDEVTDFSNEVEEQFVFGKGRAYGAEFLLKKSKGNLTGWVAYSYSIAERSFPDIEAGRWFRATYDRPHDLAIVINYQISKKLDIGVNFVYGTGKVFTPVQSFYFIEQSLSIEYGPRTSARLEPYHRFDFSINYTPKPDSKKKFRSTWNLSIYNVYNRKNPFFVFYDGVIDFNTGSVSLEGVKVSLFPIIPSITWNFNFNGN